MENISVILRGLGISSEYKLHISPDSKILDFRLNAQTLVGFDDEACQLVLERTGEYLPDSLLVRDSNIQSGDILLIIPPVNRAYPPQISITSASNKQFQSTYRQVSNHPDISTSSRALVAYKLILTVTGSEQNIWEYSIQLQSYHENNPARFFEESGRQEQQKLENFLEKALARKPSSIEMNKVLRNWCEDILLGYRETLLTLHQ